MKKSVPYEIMAAVIMVLGAILLVLVYIPIIKPSLYQGLSHQKTAPMSRYIIGTPTSLLILVGAWRLSCKAQRLKREHEQKPSA